MSGNDLKFDIIARGEIDKELELLMEEVSKLTGRCVELTEGTMCRFCDVRCKFRTDDFVGKGEKI